MYMYEIASLNSKFKLTSMHKWQIQSMRRSTGTCAVYFRINHSYAE